MGSHSLSSRLIIVWFRLATPVGIESRSINRRFDMHRNRFIACFRASRLDRIARSNPVKVRSGFGCQLISARVIIHHPPDLTCELASKVRGLIISEHEAT